MKRKKYSCILHCNLYSVNIQCKVVWAEEITVKEKEEVISDSQYNGDQVYINVGNDSFM